VAAEASWLHDLCCGDPRKASRRSATSRDHDEQARHQRDPLAEPGPQQCFRALAKAVADAALCTGPRGTSTSPKTFSQRIVQLRCADDHRTSHLPRTIETQRRQPSQLPSSLSRSSRRITQIVAAHVSPAPRVGRLPTQRMQQARSFRRCGSQRSVRSPMLSGGALQGADQRGVSRVSFVDFTFGW
jgi:hypothetical protein